MFTREGIEIHCIDLVEKPCEICGKNHYPSIFVSLVGEISYGYVCRECIVQRELLDDRTIGNIVNNYIESRLGVNYIESSWIHDESKAELIEKFLKVEEEDSQITKSGDLMKATIFKQELSKGRAVYSEREMYDYFSFYGNNPEIVLTLRNELFKNKSNRFLKSMYIVSRSRALSDRQIETLKRNKVFKFISRDLDEFWALLPEIAEYINRKGEVSRGVLKVKNIIDLVLQSEFYTVRQKEVIDRFAKKNNLKVGGN